MCSGRGISVRVCVCVRARAETPALGGVADNLLSGFRDTDGDTDAAAMLRD